MQTKHDHHVQGGGGVGLRLVVVGVGEKTAITAVAVVAIMSGAIVALVALVVAMSALVSRRVEVGEVFCHLCQHEGSAGQHGRIGDVGGLKDRFDRWSVKNRWRVGVEETLGHHVGHGSQHGSIGLVKHVGDTWEGVQVTLSSTEVREHVGPSLGNDRATMPTEEFLMEDGNLGEDQIG